MRKPALTQCKKCQRFFHAASQCHMPYRCVKCAENHAPGCCPLDQSNNKTKPKCVNCKGEHTANDAKQCPAFQRAIKLSNERKEKNAKPNQTKRNEKYTQQPSQASSTNQQQPRAQQHQQQTRTQQPSTYAAAVNSNNQQRNTTKSHQSQSNISAYFEQQQKMMADFLSSMFMQQNEFMKSFFNV